MQSTTNNFFPIAEENSHFFYSTLTNDNPGFTIESPSFPSLTPDFGNASDPGFVFASHALDLNQPHPWSTTPFTMFNPPIPFSSNPYTSFCPPLPLPPSNSFTPFNPPIPLSPIPYAFESFYPPPPMPNSSTSFGPPLPLPLSWMDEFEFNPPIPSAPISFYPHPPTNLNNMFNLPLPSSSSTRPLYAPLPPNSSILFGPSLPLPSPNSAPTSFGPPLPLPPATNSFINGPTPGLNLAPQNVISVQGPLVPSTRKNRTRQKSAILRSPNQRKKLLREWKRIELLQNDEYVLAFAETTVTCAGCMNDLKLDSRDGARFYPGFWNKHKRRCQSVKNMIAAKCQEKEEKEGSPKH